MRWCGRLWGRNGAVCVPPGAGGCVGESWARERIQVTYLRSKRGNKANFARIIATTPLLRHHTPKKLPLGSETQNRVITARETRTRTTYP